jgi:hypothetical protein
MNDNVSRRARLFHANPNFSRYFFYRADITVDFGLCRDGHLDRLEKFGLNADIRGRRENAGGYRGYPTGM